MSTVVIGIDPGVSGAIACLVDRELLDVVDMPTFSELRGKRNVRSVNVAELADILRGYAVSALTTPTVIVEKVHAMPGQGVTSMFSFGEAYAAAYTVPAVLQYPTILIEPRIWKKQMGLTADKQRSRRVATETWPQMAHLFRLTKHDGRAEAALLAQWGTHRC
jgi:crossover junction endodeoxyribonuclease RuvC